MDIIILEVNDDENNEIFDGNFNFSDEPYEDEMIDYLNLKDERNKDNTYPGSYNCGGFALKTYSWYRPYDRFNHGWADISNESLEEYVEHMLKEIPYLRRLNTERDAREDEEIVLFRVGSGDFHFLRKVSRNEYHHKVGARSYIEKMTQDEAYDEYWKGRYDSEIVVFGLSKTIREKILRRAG